MTLPKKRSTDAEAVAALIWLAFVVPEDVIPLEDDGKAYLSFHRALDLYADARDRERAAHEADLRSIEADRQQLLQEVEAEAKKTAYHKRMPIDYIDHLDSIEHPVEPEPEPVPDPDTPSAPQPPEHTHTHTQAGRAAPQK